MKTPLPPAVDLPLRTHLYMGAVRFDVHASEPLKPFVQEPGLYDPFRRAGEGVATRRVCMVRVHRGLPDVPKARRPVFDASPAWRLEEEPSGTRWVTRTGSADPSAEPLWIARIEPEASQVDVYCGPALAPEGHLLDPIGYPLDQLLLLHLLDAAEMLLVHGACVEVDGTGCLFAGVSGAGKTTLSRLFAAADPARILTDDRALLVKTDTGWRVGGTPWPGEGRYALNRWRPLGRIAFLEKADRDGYRPLRPVEALNRLLPVLSIPWFDSARTDRLLALAEEVLRAAPVMTFHFTPTPAAVDPVLHATPGGRGL